MAGKKPRRPAVDERLDKVDIALARIQAGLNPVLKLNETLQQLQPTMNQLLGELRAVRILLDEKGQFKHHDKPRPPLERPPVPERVV